MKKHVLNHQNIHFSGNVQNKLEIRYSPFEYKIEIDRKHGQIIMIKRKNKLECDVGDMNGKD